ncbi:Imm1 family immunity protein [Streptomyces sp. FXJ1.4098]|uniref:Imm1 family immunity protein n=1 Tax=Streptomyces sp. NPDC020845 TaxID=3365096 RepID=UPI00299C3A77|nr:Imm1 family immunity protein [Streptomyces sp. FXJ1.4098]
MILNAVIHGRYHYAQTWVEMEELIAEVVENSIPEQPGPGINPGEDACFMFARDRHSAETFSWWPDNYLRIAVNPETGYGALVWFVSAERHAEPDDEISKHFWVSDNPNPPDFDPRVVSDPGYPKFHDPRSTLPIAQVRAALEEFCREGTGNRPQRIRWVTGEMDGQRHDISANSD